MRRRTAQSGQVLAEYVIMFVLIVLVALALLALFGGFSKQGKRMIDLVSYEVP